MKYALILREKKDIYYGTITKDYYIHIANSEKELKNWIDENYLASNMIGKEYLIIKLSELADK